MATKIDLDTLRSIRDDIAEQQDVSLLDIVIHELARDDSADVAGALASFLDLERFPARSQAADVLRGVALQVCRGSDEAKNFQRETTARMKDQLAGAEQFALDDDEFDRDQVPEEKLTAYLKAANDEFAARNPGMYTTN